MATRIRARARTDRRLARGIVYNLFSRPETPELLCAVPEDRPVPAFVDRLWSYRGRITEPGRALPGFDERAAATSVRLNGFYLLHHLTGNRGWLAHAPARRRGAVAERTRGLASRASLARLNEHPAPGPAEIR